MRFLGHCSNVTYLGDHLAKREHCVCLYWSPASSNHGGLVRPWACRRHFRLVDLRKMQFDWPNVVTDAFLLHGSELHLYNKINIENVDINTRTVAMFEALPTCISQSSCDTCLDLSSSSNFTCFWCEAAGHCSDGADRYKREIDYTGRG